MFCRYCGKKIPNKSKYCVHCGKHILTGEDTNFSEKKSRQDNTSHPDRYLRPESKRSLKRKRITFFDMTSHLNMVPQNVIVVIVGIIVFILLIGVLARGCGKTESRENDRNKSVNFLEGQWSSTLYLKDFVGDLGSIERNALELVAGNLSVEIIAEFRSDGGFSYSIDTDQIVDVISDAVSGAVGLFIDIDVSSIVSDLINDALDSSDIGNQIYYSGTYTVDNNNRILAYCGGIIRFKLDGKTLIQVDGNGSEICRFRKK